MLVDHLGVQVGDFARLGVYRRRPLQLARGNNRRWPLGQFYRLAVAPLCDLGKIRNLTLVRPIPRVQSTLSLLACASYALLQGWLHGFVGTLSVIELLRDRSFCLHIIPLHQRLIVIILMLLLRVQLRFVQMNIVGFLANQEGVSAGG